MKKKEIEEMLINILSKDNNIKDVVSIYDSGILSHDNGVVIEAEDGDMFVMTIVRY